MLLDIKNCLVKEVTDVQNGTSQRSGQDWTKATVILEQGDYNDTFPMTVFGEDKVRQVSELVGHRADIKFDIRGREYKGRWFSDVNLRYINPIDTGTQENARNQAPKAAPAPEPVKEDDPDADLPF